MANDILRNPNKRHYDITMSKRTRKPLNLQESKREVPPRGDGHEVEKKSSSTTEGGNHDNDRRKSLEQLIHLGEGTKCRSSLGQHFTQDKQLQLVVKQQEEVMAGVKPKGSVSRYIKVLSHLIKVKHDSSLGSRKKTILALMV